MNRKLKTLLLAATAGAMMTMAAGAMAQAPAGGPGAGPPRGGPGMGGPGMGAPLDRAGAIQRFGLGDPALKLTDAQKAELDKAADAYVEAMGKLPPMTPGSQPSADAMTARTKVRDDFNAAIAKVLTADQKKTWDAAQATRRGGPGGGMGGPPGGAGGPPGGARPPGQ